MPPANSVGPNFNPQSRFGREFNPKKLKAGSVEVFYHRRGYTSMQPIFHWQCPCIISVLHRRLIVEETSFFEVLRVFSLVSIDCTYVIISLLSC